MIDIAVKDLVKSFEIGDNLLDGLTFEVQEGQCVAILGRNGCGKTTLFRILTGEIGYDEGEVYVNPNKKLGLISQIPRYPAGYTVEEVLRSAFRKLLEVRQRMEELESQMTASTPKDILNEYDRLTALPPGAAMTWTWTRTRSATAWGFRKPCGSRNLTCSLVERRPG